MPLPPELEALLQQLDANQREADAVVAGLSEAQGTRRPDETSWCVSECIDHLATANRVYLEAMSKPLERARSRGRLRRGPAKPGVFGQMFVNSLLPKHGPKLKAPKKIRPRPIPPLGDSYASFTSSQRDVVAFVRANADLDLAGIGFPNPFIPGLRFSLATGLHVIAAHEQRHLEQAWRVRRAVEGG